MGKVIAIIVVVLVVIGGGVVVYMNRDNLFGAKTSSTEMENMSQSTQSSTPEATNAVTIDGFAFSPSSITVKKGTTVTWTNKDSTAHTVTETDGKTGPHSDMLEQGMTYSFTFDEVGTFQYHCSLHTSMTGTVTVTE